MDNTKDLESLLNSNEKFTNEYLDKLTENESDLTKFIDDLKTFKENHKPYELTYAGPDSSLDDDSYDAYYVNKQNFISALNEFRIQSRLAILSEKKRLLYVIREEELLTLINKLQNKVAEYDNFVKENGEEKAAREFSNAQLNEIAMIKSQSIPMYLVELETLSSAVADNEVNYFNATERAYSFASGIIRFLESIKDGREGK